MKKLVAISLAIALCCTPLSASALAPPPQQTLMTIQQEMYTSSSTDVLVYVIVDQVTGINYIAITNKLNGGTCITPRLTTDNKLYASAVS